MKIVYKNGYNPSKEFTVKEITTEIGGDHMLVNVVEQEEPLWATHIYPQNGKIVASLPENY